MQGNGEGKDRKKQEVGYRTSCCSLLVERQCWYASVKPLTSRLRATPSQESMQSKGKKERSNLLPTRRSQLHTQKSDQSNALKKEKEKIKKILKLQPVGASGMDLGASWINPGVPAVLSEEEG